MQHCQCVYINYINHHHHTTDVRDKDNKTPLHFACETGSKDLVQYLVEEAKCDVGTVYNFGI